MKGVIYKLLDGLSQRRLYRTCNGNGSRTPIETGMNSDVFKGFVLKRDNEGRLIVADNHPP